MICVKVAGLILGVFLVLPLLTGSFFAEAKADEPITSIKKDMKEIKKPSQDKSVKITSITKSRMLAILYVVGVEVCAGKDKLYSPELNLISDRDSITVKVAGLIMPKACKTAEFFIRANNPNSITVEFADVVYRYPKRSP
ncbi:hypothetical protein C4565_09820 [Candidatus Parcubacteria bacterium]|nr:MAG: hypothetical protein C4565_09820 [Candidatus Parcubacteria bacterium]